MELKRILARDLRAATEKAVSLYGTDALVVSHEHVNGQTEVIVAVDLEPAFDRETLELVDTDAADAETDDLGGLQAEALSANNANGPEFEAIFSETLKPSSKRRAKKSSQVGSGESPAQQMSEQDPLTQTKSIGQVGASKRESVISDQRHEDHREQIGRASCRERV